MKKEQLGGLIRRKREAAGLSREALGSRMSVSPTAIQNWEKGLDRPKYERAKALAEILDINIALLLNDPSFVGGCELHDPTEEYIVNTPLRPAAANVPGPKPNDNGIDPVIRAMSDIKDIFDSGDPILIPAIQANLSAFKRALLREQQFVQVMRENKELKERIARLETLCSRIPELEAEIATLRAENKALREENEAIRQENKALRTDVNRLKATYEDPGEGSGHPANTKDQAM